MKKYKRILLLSFLSIAVGLFFLINALTIKPNFKYLTYGQTNHSIDGQYKMYGSGIVTTNKYKVIRAKVKVIVYNENGEMITSEVFDYSEHKLVNYSFIITNNVPKQTKTEIYGVVANNILDMIFSFILITSGIWCSIKTLIECNYFNFKKEIN